MTSRERFEAWYADYHNEACEQYGGIDCTNPKGIAEDAWQAARREALEEAAYLCDQLWTRCCDADECADAIRALAGSTEAR